MTRNIYALLVGIDEYPQGVTSLQGCVNDINAIESYLMTRINAQKYQLHPKKLLNQEATRQAMIDGFKTHLCQAGSDDIAFFYYCGHGSQEPAPIEFLSIEPDRQLETLVCYDSRLHGGFDLADKELAYLLAKVAQKNPQIVLIADACHSGSGFRDTEPPAGVRQTSGSKNPRAMKDFIFSDVMGEVTNLSAQKNEPQKRSGWQFSTGDHILFSGCLDSELAKEYVLKKRGAFSYFLLDTLESATSSLTYREVFDRTKALVRARFHDQSPQLEATQPEFWEQPFLGFNGDAAIGDRQRYASFSCENPNDSQPRWMINQGAIHHLPQGMTNEPIRFALYAQGQHAQGQHAQGQPDVAVGEVEVIEVLPEKSIVKFIKTPDNVTPQTVLNAILKSLPRPPMPVFLDGDTAEDKQALQEVAHALKDSLYVKTVDTLVAAEYRLWAHNQEYVITQPHDDRPLIRQVTGYTEDGANQVAKQLGYIAHWLTVVEQKNPTSSLPIDAVKMQIYQNGQELQDEQLRVEYRREGETLIQPRIQIKLTNTTQRRLYCTLLDLSELYGVSSPFFDGAGVFLDPGSDVNVTLTIAGKLTTDIPMSVPKELWEQGVTEYQDILKLIVSTDEFDPKPLLQSRMDAPMLRKLRSRDVGLEDETPPPGDWITSQISIVTVRPQKSTEITAKAPALMGSGVTILAHPALQATARLTTVSQVTRDLGTRPPILQANSQPFQFTASRGADSGLNALELTVDAQTSETLKLVTPATPLKLTVEQALEPGEYVLPLAYDGEFVLPLGYGVTKAGVTVITLDRLPDPEATRSLGGSVRIFFQKVVAEQLGREFAYPLLAALDVKQPEIPIADLAQLQQRVKQAKNIVLYIHGIIGDTRNMVSSVQEAKVAMNGQEQSLAQLYDLVLTFDYESLNTPIATIAEQLRDRLAAVGLGAGHPKTLHIVAHSMGGLVSRSFIEQKGGHQVVQHLIMLGTPNGGSPWATVQDWALTTMTFALNNLLIVVPPAKWLGKLVGLLEQVDITLDEMRPDSAFLKVLNASPDPQVPYTIVAGNTSIIDTTAPEAKSRVQSLLTKLNQVGMIEFPFLGDPNDTAVAVHNIKKMPSDRTYPAQVYEVACNHLVYFTSPVGLKALAEAVKATGIGGEAS
jgi:pimeloyl-ACP methyl ester carboxylesterase